MKLKLSIISSLLCMTSMHSTTPTKDFTAITLDHGLLQTFDGTSQMDGNKFGNMMKLRMLVNVRRFGEKTPNGMVGFYTFEGKKINMQSLVELEQQLAKSNSIADQKRLNELNNLLKWAMDEYIELSQPFLVDAQGTKSQQMKLITEWATKANRKESYLLAWGACKEGEEKNVILNNIHSFKDFDQFFSDLVYYLETLMRACPIAREQFKELIKQQNHNK